MEVCSFGSPSIVGCGHHGFQRFGVEIHGCPLLGLFLLFVFVYFCRSSLKLPTPLLSYVVLLWNMHRCTPHLFPSVLMGPRLVRLWGCAVVFPNFDMFISLPVVTSFFTSELYAIFLAHIIHFLFSSSSLPCTISLINLNLDHRSSLSIYTSPFLYLS